MLNVGGGLPVSTREFAEIVMRQYGSDRPAIVPGEYRFGDTRHIFSDITSLSMLGWSPKRTPVDSVASYAEWLEGIETLDGILDAASTSMHSLGVVRKVAP